MLKHLAWFELRWFLSNPSFWICAAVLFLFGFFVTIFTALEADGSALLNSALSITTTLVLTGFLCIFSSAVLVANSIVRDKEQIFAEILFATRLNKFDYLIGRFIGALSAAGLVSLVLPISIALAYAMPWVQGP